MKGLMGGQNVAECVCVCVGGGVCSCQNMCVWYAVVKTCVCGMQLSKHVCVVCSCQNMCVWYAVVKTCVCGVQLSKHVCVVCSCQNMCVWYAVVETLCDCSTVVHTQLYVWKK